MPPRTAVDKASGRALGICWRTTKGWRCWRRSRRSWSAPDGALFHGLCFDGALTYYRREDEAANPLNVYGETKRAGELALGNPRH